MKKTKTLESNSSPQAPEFASVAGVDITPAPEPVLTMAQKIRVGHALTSALDDRELKAKVMSLSEGQTLWQLLNDAVETKLELLMHGPREKLPQDVLQLTEVVRKTTETLNHFQQVISLFHSTPLASTLVKLSGQPELFEKIKQLPPPTNAPQFQAQPQINPASVFAPHNGPTKNPYITHQDVNNPPTVSEKLIYDLL